MISLEPIKSTLPAGTPISEEVMRVVEDATFVLANKGIRTEVILKADIRPGYTNMMQTKVQKVEGFLGDGK